MSPVERKECVTTDLLDVHIELPEFEGLIDCPQGFPEAFKDHGVPQGSLYKKMGGA